MRVLPKVARPHCLVHRAWAGRGPTAQVAQFCGALPSCCAPSWPLPSGRRCRGRRCIARACRWSCRKR
eukprot:6208240-Pyramimonas_sp.AAC.1